MSEHKTRLSNWAAEQKTEYWKRRRRGLSGQTGYVNLHQVVLTQEAGPQRVALGFMRGPGISSRQPRLDSGKVNNQPIRQPVAKVNKSQTARSNGRGD